MAGFGEFDGDVEGTEAMEETSEVEGSCLAVRLAGMPNELYEGLIKCKLPLSDILCGVLISASVTEDVQKKGFAHDSEEHR